MGISRENIRSRESIFFRTARKIPFTVIVQNVYKKANIANTEYDKKLAHPKIIWRNITKSI